MVEQSIAGVSRITVEERRRTRLYKQRASLEFIRQLSVPLALSKPPATRPRWVWEIALITVLLKAGWFLSHVVELHPPRSIADMAPRLDASHHDENDG